MPGSAGPARSERHGLVTAIQGASRRRKATGSEEPGPLGLAALEVASLVVAILA